MAEKVPAKQPTHECERWLCAVPKPGPKSQKKSARGQSSAVANVRVVSGKRLWAMKRKAQARSRALVASDALPPEAVLLLRPDRLKGASIEWPDAPLIDD